MTVPAISVAMATYNGLPYIKEQLASILAQSVPATEIVVCDDQSTDGTWEYLIGMSAGDRRIVPHRNDRRLGSTKNFERAIGLSTGDVIFLSDQDDTWVPTKIEELTAALHARNAVLAMSNGDLVNEQGAPLGVSLWESNEIDEAAAALLQSPRSFELLARCAFFTGSAFCFRASLKEFVLPIPADIWHDQWIAMIAALVEPGRLALVDRHLYHYRQHARNQIGARLPARLSAVRRAAWAKVWREVRSHQDLVIDAKYCGLAIERIQWVAARAPQLLGIERVQGALAALQRRRDHSLARCAYVEGQRPWWDPVTRRRDYRERSHGWRTMLRDLLARAFHRRTD